MILDVCDVIYVMTSQMTSQLRYYPIWRQNTKYGGRSLRLSCNDHLVTHGCSGGHVWLLPGGHAWLLWGGTCFLQEVHACSQGACVVAWGGMCGCSQGACMVALGGAWLLWGACVVAPGGYVWLLGGVHCCSREACVVAPGGTCVVALGAFMVAPGGMHGCSGGVHGCSGGGAWLLWGGAALDTTRYGDTVNEWAVRILLECILVVCCGWNALPLFFLLMFVYF